MRGETMKDKSKKSTYSTTFGVDPLKSTDFGVDPNYPPFSAVPRFRFTHNKKTDLKDRSFLNGAGYEVRTHNLDLGKVALCQLS